jgi:hypothetical protein
LVEGKAHLPGGAECEEAAVGVDGEVAGVSVVVAALVLDLLEELVVLALDPFSTFACHMSHHHHHRHQEASS